MDVTTPFGNGPGSLPQSTPNPPISPQAPPIPPMAQPAGTPAPAPNGAPSRAPAENGLGDDLVQSIAAKAPAAPTPQQVMAGQPQPENKLGEFGKMIAATEAGSLTGTALLGAPWGTMMGAGVGAGMYAYHSYMSKYDEAAKFIDAAGKKQLAERGSDEAIKAGALAAGAIPFGEMVGGALSKLSRGISEFIDAAPMSRAQKSVLLTKEIRDFASRMGGDTMTETGQNVTGLLKEIEKNAGSRYIGKYDGIAESLATQRNAKVPLDGVISKMQDVLRQEGVEFRGTQIVNLPEEVASALREQTARGPSFPNATVTGPGNDILAEIKFSQSGFRKNGYFDSIATNPQRPFGSINGASYMQKMLDDYGALIRAQERGGMTVPEFRSWNQAYGEAGTPARVPFMDATPSRFESASRAINSSIIETRNNFYRNIFQGGKTPEGMDLFQAYNQDFARYGSVMDSVERVNRIFQKETISPQLAVEQAISTKNPQVISDLQNIFGKDNPEVMAQLRGATINKALNDAVQGSKTGLPDLQKFAQNIKNYGQMANSREPNAINMLFKPSEINEMNALVHRATKVMTSDISSDADRGAIKGLFYLVADPVRWAMGGNPEWSVARDLYAIGSRNTKAYDYLTKVALPEQLAQAQASKNLMRVGQLSSVADRLDAFRMLSYEGKGPAGVRRLVATPALEAIMGKSFSDWRMGQPDTHVYPNPE